MNPGSVLISGAGIACPTLAVWLKAAGLQPTLVERGSSLLTVKADVTRTVLE
jgi:2-polyprenyl-6-methoxyphenol hydroxylase-like FAD-dependent oxidoreductase